MLKTKFHAEGAQVSLSHGRKADRDKHGLDPHGVRPCNRTCYRGVAAQREEIQTFPKQQGQDNFCVSGDSSSGLAERKVSILHCVTFLILSITPVMLKRKFEELREIIILEWQETSNLEQTGRIIQTQP